jgi:pimeloyl-ACP methyl ester carboxylesterase
MADVLLLHGAWCDSWFWQPLIERLASRSIEAVAPDLPREDPDARTADYVECAIDALGDGADPVVVGHSLAGILLERVAAVRSVARLVYLAAFVPAPGASLHEQWRSEPETFVAGWDAGLSPGADGSNHWSDLEAARLALFGHAPEGLGAEAARHLGRQFWGLSRDRFDGSLSTSSTYLAPTHDLLLNARLLRGRATELKGTVGTIPGDHCPMLSEVDALAEVLERIVNGP